MPAFPAADKFSSVGYTDDSSIKIFLSLKGTHACAAAFVGFSPYAIEFVPFRDENRQMDELVWRRLGH